MVIKDKLGTYQIIQGSILQENLNLLNVCGPCSDDDFFYTNFLLALSSLTGTYIMGATGTVFWTPLWTGLQELTKHTPEAGKQHAFL